MRIACIFSVIVVLAGCGIVAPAPEAQHEYDLNGVAPVNGPALPAVRLNVRALAELHSHEMYYRYASDPGEVRSYAYHRWAATPAQLLEQRLKLLSTGDAIVTPLSLALEILTFEQFLWQNSGEARISVEALLAYSGITCRRRIFSVSEPMSTIDASGAAQAFSAASLELAKQLSAWIDSSEPCPEVGQAVGYIAGTQPETSVTRP